jgi:hypothetical protein
MLPVLARHPRVSNLPQRTIIVVKQLNGRTGQRTKTALLTCYGMG